ncbi:MAG: type II toxin-antitoxin system VapB family antitoxin [Actinomycetota bacterium]
MGLNIKNADVERLAAEVAGLTGESKTEAIRRALDERKGRLAGRVATRSRHDAVRRFLEREIWPLIPPEELGRRTGKRRREAILGYGREGV